MQTEIRVAAIQMNAGLDKEANLAQAERLVRQAAERGAQLIVLPELFSAYGPLAKVVPLAEPIPGPTSLRLGRLAQELGIYLCGGSIAEASSVPQRAHNTALLFNPQGELVTTYRKLHLFDVNLVGECTVRESDQMLPGDGPVVVDTPLGSLGFAICYDVRFPELFRALTDLGLEILLFPSAFTATTGRAHWEPLLRARAIENQAFVIAANQVGAHPGGLVSFGHSCCIDPWGTIVAAAENEPEAVVFATFRAETLEQTRRKIPALTHRRRW